MQAQSNACTIYIYLCGSNLETKQGLAGKNLDELLEADIPSDTKVVVQTGGSTTWRSHNIKNDKLQRYEVRDKQLVLLDELENDDALEHTELASAFKGAQLPFTFDMVIFDTCFMSTLENAALISDYAQYMVVSQEVVPSGGIDYKALVQDFSAKNNTELGESICDSYLAKCKAKELDDAAELSFLDLSQTNSMIQAVNDLCEQFEMTQDAKDATFRIENATKSSAIYGAKNISNLFDLQGFTNATEFFDDSPSTQKVADMFDEFVVYKITGNKTESAGVSLYFPFNYDRQEFQTYIKTCPMESYAELLKSRYSNLPAQMLEFEDRGSITPDGDFKISFSEESARYLTSVTYTLAKQSDEDPDTYMLLGSDCNIKQDWDHLTFSSDFYPTWPSLWGQRLLTSIVLMLPHVVAFSAPVRANNAAWDFYAVYAFGDNYREGSTLMEPCGVDWTPTAFLRATTPCWREATKSRHTPPRVQRRKR